MLFIASFFRVIPLAFAGHNSVPRPMTKEEQTAQRKVVSQVRRLAKQNSSHFGRSRLRNNRNVAWLYLPAAIRFRQPDDSRGLNIKYRSAMVAVTGPYFTLNSGQMGCEVRSYLVSAGKANACLTIHMVVHVFDQYLNAWAPLPKRRLDPTTEFIDRRDLFSPSAEELTELYLALVALN